MTTAELPFAADRNSRSMSALRGLKIARWVQRNHLCEAARRMARTEPRNVSHSWDASTRRYVWPNSGRRGIVGSTFRMCRLDRLHCLDEGAARGQIVIDQKVEAWRKLRPRDAGWPYDPFVTHDTASHFLDERNVR